MNLTEITELIGKTLTGIEVKDKEEIIFTADDGSRYRMFHYQDCCEDVTIDDINGDLNDLIGAPITVAEESTKEGGDEWGTETWTFYKIATVKGHVVIRWYGSSNGYYSESVDFEKLS